MMRANWHPLTWLSHALDFQFFGRSPAGPHVVNLLLHTLNVVLLFWVLWRATGFSGRSAMVAALFALHPINVQSVAWVAERKNLLSMTFFLLALGAYRWYAESVIPSAEVAVANEASRACPELAEGDPYAARALPKVGVPRFAAQSRGRSLGMTTHIGRYLVVMLLFAFGLMAKPQIITLPLVLLLWDYWPLQRMTAGNVSRLIWEKLPLFALAAASAWITLLAHSAGQAVRYLPLSLRIANAILSYARYLKRALWP